MSRFASILHVLLIFVGLIHSACLSPSSVSQPPPVLSLPSATTSAISAQDLAAHVTALTDERMEGRLAGSKGERFAADYLARAFAAAGLEPAGDEGEFSHRFEFTSGISLGPMNTLQLESSEGAAPTPLVLDRDWRPLAFSRSGEIEATGVVFAGYGLVGPEQAEGETINDYETERGELDVRDQWVLVFRGLPEILEGERRQELQRRASLRYKAMIARDRGARGILFVSGPLSTFRNELVPLRFDASLAGTRLAVLSLSDSAAEQLIAATGIGLEALQAIADARVAGESAAAFPPLDSRVAARIELETERAQGHNVVGRLQVGDAPSSQTIVIGAHYDHLGRGETSGSLASGDEVGAIHPGADDNASGTALLIELAESLVGKRQAGEALGKRDLVFAAWSGEELGLLGSDAWASENINPHTKESGPVAYLNFDMVGRLTEKLVIQGFGSSPEWDALLDSALAESDLGVVRQPDSFLPTDATSFYTQGVPILSAFTGVHSEYHTPRDTADRLDLEGSVAIGELFSRIAEALSSRESPPAYQAQKAPAAGEGRSGFRVFLGTIPDYAQTEVEGVRLSGVAPGGPAEAGGLQRGDVIVEVDGRPIENLYDYTYALDVLRVGVPAKLSVLRGGERLRLEVVPASRD